ncbi:oxidoreductase-like domain-containing protein [Colwellia echini]|uniref:Oxidoreductase-like domain-containing protein n=1 Tax=Colwellia echini TaxID=1982103 RepID=A0ABY3MSQ2_9GAMM|nr:oxidoreductase-like domain-containing protein [Colwellia echini]TYK64214.1 hypothetical protein CWS31_016870 [Colwellia echini]
MLNNKPTPPADNECCDSACDPCVWDNYYRKLKIWRMEQVIIKEQQQLKSTTDKNPTKI